MKRHTLVILFVALTSVALAHAQAPATGTVPGQRGPAGQRQGPAPGTAETAKLVNRAVVLEPVTTYTVTTAWWSNAALMTRLGLTDVQKSRIEATFEAHRPNLLSSKAQLEKEEAQLAKLLEAETVDRSGTFTQINRVIQARGEMERVNATMTMEMREQLTRAQWTELQASQPRMMIRTTSGDAALPFTINPVATPGVRGGARGGGNPQP